MTPSRAASPIDDAVAQLEEAAAAKKCWFCRCLRESIVAIEQALSDVQRPAGLGRALATAKGRLLPTRYDCLGCDVCYAAMATNALNRAGLAVEPDACPTERPMERAGWPPLPGSYQVLRYRAPVAVCTLTDDALCASIVGARAEHIAIVGTLQTENLGIERLIENVLANPHIRFVVLCGEDARKKIGHLPGASLAALAQAGLDEHSRIIGAPGKRPVIRNLSHEAVEHFRRTVQVVDLIGTSEMGAILDATQRCSERNPGPAEPFVATRVVTPIAGYVRERMVPDPAGYFVAYADKARRRLALEHYTDTGVLDARIEGESPAELYIAAIDRQLVSRLDHAAYLGRELARAERALQSNEVYVQEGALERPSSMSQACGCSDLNGGGCAASEAQNDSKGADARRNP
jgi:tetrahydromethanopterin S-methyltransferase subunit A